MTGELFINGKDAWNEWGVNMGDSFLDTIDSFPAMKDYIENDSRLEHGKRVIVAEPRVASRSITLHFTIKGENESDFRMKRKGFETELIQGKVNVNIPALGDDVYKLLYLGQNVTYGLSRGRSFCHLAARFEEPNPMDRTLNEESEEKGKLI